MSADDKSPEQGRISMIGDYRLEKELGRGGMGVVYRAIQLSMNRPVALKILPRRLAKNESFVVRFLREARSAARLQHPNVVVAYDVGQSPDGYYYFAMEFVKGESLRALIEREGALPEQQALALALGVAKGLKQAEQVGMIHRDVKPENILIAEDGTPKLADFGLAKAPDDASVTQSGAVFGTPYYISPEQAQGEADIDVRSDIYSLGATLYHAVTGQPPFQGKTSAVIMTMHINDPAPAPKETNPDVSGSTSRIIARMMEKRPKDRYQTAAELIEDLELALKGEAVQRVELGPSVAGKRASRARGRPASRTQKRSPVPLIAAILTLAIVGGGGAYLALRSEGEPARTGVPTGGQKRPPPRKAPPKKTPSVRLSPAAQLLKDADRYKARHPKDYRGQLKRYRAVSRKHPSDSEAGIARRVEKTIQQKWDAEARVEMGKLKAQADLAAARKEFGQAVAAFDAFPARLRNENWSGEIGKQVVAYTERANQAFQAVSAQAEKALAAGDVDRARKRYEEATRYGLEHLARSARNALARIDKMQATREQAQEQQKAAYLTFWRQFRERLIAGRHPDAVRLADDFHKRTSAPEVRKEVLLDRGDAQCLQQLPVTLAKGLATVKKNEVITVGGMRGQFSEYTGGQIVLKMGGTPIKRPLAKLSAVEKNELCLRAMDGETAAPYITFALACLYDKRCDVDQAEEYLVAARSKGGDTTHCEDVMERIANAEAEAEAAKLFAEARKLVAATKWVEARQALTSLLTDYASSSTASDNSKSIQELLALCTKSLTSPEKEGPAYELVGFRGTSVPEFLCWGPTRLTPGTTLKDLDGLILRTVDQAGAGKVLRGNLWMMVPADTRLPGWHVRYLLLELHAEKGVTAMARLRWDDGVAMWLNGKHVFDSGRPWRGWSEGQFRPTDQFALRAGKNRLLFRNTNGPGGGGLAVQLTAPDGKPLAGLKYRRDAAGDEVIDATSIEAGEEVDVDHRRFRKVPAELRKDIRAFREHFYLCIRRNADWMTAARTCKDLGGHLVTISSRAENDFVFRVVARHASVWIGYSDTQREGRWVWVGGSRTRFVNWGPGQPDNWQGREEFAHLESHARGRWNDNSGDRRLWFVCEWDK